MTKLNWRAYFKEFCRIHGGQPVLYRVDKETGKGGYFLFRDGWMYDRTNPAGPEYPPLNDKERLKKVQAYWTLRHRILLHELRVAKENVKVLAWQADARSAPLMATEVITREDEEGRKTRRPEIVEVNFDNLIDKVKELDAQVHEALAELEKLMSREGLAEEAQHPDKGLMSALVTAELQVLELPNGKPRKA